LHAGQWDRFFVPSYSSHQWWKIYFLNLSRKEKKRMVKKHDVTQEIIMATGRRSVFLKNKWTYRVSLTEKGEIKKFISKLNSTSKKNVPYI
jgi:hypothetical protein